MSAAGADFLYTVVLVAIFLGMLLALVKLVEVLFVRIQADYITGYHADAISQAWIFGRDQHQVDVRWSMRRARRQSHMNGEAR